MATPVMLLLAGGLLFLLGGKRRPGLRQCIEGAAAAIGDTVLWQSEEERQQQASRLAMAGLSKAAHCVGELDQEVLAVCLGWLNDAIASDLRAMAKPLTTRPQLEGLADHLRSSGFPQAADCFAAHARSL